MSARAASSVSNSRDRELEHVLEVDLAAFCLAPLVLAVDGVHQVGRDRRLVAVERRQVRVRLHAPRLGPFDLGRQIAGRPELVRRRERVRDLPEQQRLRRQDPADRVGRVAMELSERRRMERARLDPARAESRETGLHHARRLVRERDREDLLGPERSGDDLPGDPPRDRRRLARPGARQDADRAANGLCRPPLLAIQSVENVHPATVATAPVGFRPETVTRVQQHCNKSVTSAAEA